MKNLFILICLSLLSFKELSATVLPPSKYTAGAKFTHISCAALSTKPVQLKLVKEYNINVNELGIGSYGEGSISVDYGAKKECQFIMKYTVTNGSTYAEYTDSIHTDKNSCLPGRIMLDSIFASGFTFTQSLSDYSKISLELSDSHFDECNGQPIYLEFTRTR